MALDTQVERYDLVVRILRAVESRGERFELLRLILGDIKAGSGFDAVGIRLRDGEDFPYFVTLGFPGYFVELERSLCAVGLDGELRRDSEGNACLECMCGSVIRGRVDPSLPFFTEGGSFWTNSTSDLLASAADENILPPTRNQCNKAGYESVALIPLRSDAEILGLLQLNDRRKDMFDADLILFFEELCRSRNVTEMLASS